MNVQAREEDEESIDDVDNSNSSNSDEDSDGTIACEIHQVPGEEVFDNESVPLFFFMDCEASSGVPYRDDIVEIAMRCSPYKEDLEDFLFYSLIHTSKNLCKFAMLHGFTKKLLQNQPSFENVMNKAFDWLQAMTETASQYLNHPVFPVLLCHGGEAFDFLMLFSQLERTGMTFEKLKEINLHFADTFPHLEMYKSAKHPLLAGLEALGIKNLEEKWFGTQEKKAFHRAKTDVDAMARLFIETPLDSFLQDIPIYSTEEWIEYYEEKKCKNQTKKEFEEILPSSISGIQRKFTIRTLLRKGYNMEGLRALYIECTEPHHFRQELIDNLEIKGTNASKLMRYFSNQGLEQTGVRQYVVKITNNMQAQKWTIRTNQRGRRFQRHVANVLPPIMPSGGSGFDFDDATESSSSERMKDLMKSFAEFQLQLHSPDFWKDVPTEEQENKYDIIDETNGLAKWEETEVDWKNEDVGLKHSLKLSTPTNQKETKSPLLPTPNTPKKPFGPLLPTPYHSKEYSGPLLQTKNCPKDALLPTPVFSTELATSFNYMGNESKQKPADKIHQEHIKPKQEQQFKNGFKPRWKTMEFQNKNYRNFTKFKVKDWSRKPDCYQQWYQSSDQQALGERWPSSCGRTFQEYYGYTAGEYFCQASARQASEANNLVHVNYIHCSQTENEEVIRYRDRKYNNGYRPRSGNRRNQIKQLNTKSQGSGTNEIESQQGARRKTYFKYQKGKQSNQNKEDWCSVEDRINLKDSGTSRRNSRKREPKVKRT